MSKGRKIFEVTAGETVPTPRVRGFAELESSRAGHLRRIADMEKEICRLQAGQIREAAAYVRDQMEEDSRRGLPVGNDQARVMVAEIAVARGVSNLSASSWLSDAYGLDDSLPCTLAALERGELSLWSARAIGSEVGLIEDLALRRLADEAIAEEAAGMVPGKIKTMAQTRVIAIDPDAADARAGKARAARYISATAGEPGAGFLTAALPAELVQACWSSLNDHATAVYAGGDQQARSVTQIMCDTFVERLTGITKLGDLSVHVDLVMSEMTLLGLDDNPAQLIGLGPIPAQIARLIIDTGTTWIRRLFTDPVDGSALVADTRRRLYRGPLRDLIVARDQRCRGPQCVTRIKDVDHIVEHAKGGRTNRKNGEGVSKGCHTMRDRVDVTVKSQPDSNAITWTLPSGAEATSLPPPALGYGSGERAQVLRRQRLLRGVPHAGPAPPRPLDS